LILFVKNDFFCGNLFLLVLYICLTKIRSLAEYKLPEAVVPLEYDIHLIPYMEETAPPKNFTFDGHVQILLRADKATALIKLHANDMEILKDSVKLQHAETGEEIEVVDVTLQTDDRHFLEISLASDLAVSNNYKLDINFVGKLNDDMEGFYRSNYFEDGIEK
jgi:Peptidase M1 N-terminal domain